MEFDATFLFAVISFLVFIFIMNKIFYAPILRIMQERQAFVENNYNSAKETQTETKKQHEFRNAELDKSRDEARSLISEHSQKFKEERNIRIAQYKEELYSDIANQRDSLKQSARDVKETLKDNVVDIAKDISQMLLGDAVSKDTIDKSKIEE